MYFFPALQKLNIVFPVLFPHLTVCCHVGYVCQVPPQRCGRGNVLGPDRAVGQQEQQEDTCAEDAPVGGSTYGTQCLSRPLLSAPSAGTGFKKLSSHCVEAPSLLRQCGGHPECQQPD